MKFQRLRGTQDIYGQSAEQFFFIEESARKVFSRFGYQELRTPILELKEVFTRALGGETDVVQKEMYEFEDRSKEKVAMRPEGTAGVVRAYVENNFDKTMGLAKFFYMGPMFRSERPQAGRLRQFHQIGVELLGTSSPYADAEAIHSLTAFLDEVGVSGYQVKLNNLGTIEEREAFKKILFEYFKPFKSNLCEDCQLRITKNVFRLLDCKVESCRAIAKKSPLLTEHLSEESKKHFAQACSALKIAGITYTEDPRMVRGLDYYTKTVFEVTHPDLGSQDALAAGGRYDKLVESFGGPSVGAVGFALGVERLAMVLKSEAKAADNQESYFVVTLGERAFQEGLKILASSRNRGVKIAMDFEGKSMKSQMRSADKSGSRFVIILGDNELDKGIFILKDMKDGSQKELKLTEIESAIKLGGSKS